MRRKEKHVKKIRRQKATREKNRPRKVKARIRRAAKAAARSAAK